MANPTLIQVGTLTIPLSRIKTDTFNITKSTLDLDSYRDATGELHRTVLSHKVFKVEFETPPCYDLPSFLAQIRNQYIDATAKSCSVKVYDFETASYITQRCYVPDITVKIKENSPKGFLYDSCRIAFIGY